MKHVLLFLLRVLSYFPMPLLYVLSDILWVWQTYVIRYRYRVIHENMTAAFPKKTKKEIKQLQAQFNHYLCDFLVETLKSYSLSPQQLSQRYTFDGIECLQKSKDEQRDIMLLTGHIFNWEGLTAGVKVMPTKYTYAVYHPQKNKEIEQIVNQNRSRFGTQPLPMKQVLRFMLKQPKGKLSTYLFVADQSPAWDNLNTWLSFLNQDTAVFDGFDKICQKRNMLPIYCETQRVKRGYYHTTFKEIQPKGKNFEPLEIVQQFFHLLEQNIQKDPANWLWSHRRWKHSKPKTNA